MVGRQLVGHHINRLLQHRLPIWLIPASILSAGIATQVAYSRWFEKDLLDNVAYANVSDDWHGIAVPGPKSCDLLARLSREDLSTEAFRFRDLRQTYVAGVPVILNRIRFSDKLGCEIHCRPQYLLRLAEASVERRRELICVPEPRIGEYRLQDRSEDRARESDWSDPAGIGQTGERFVERM